MLWSVTVYHFNHFIRRYGRSPRLLTRCHERCISRSWKLVQSPDHRSVVSWRRLSRRRSGRRPATSHRRRSPATKLWRKTTVRPRRREASPPRRGHHALWGRPERPARGRRRAPRHRHRSRWWWWMLPALSWHSASGRRHRLGAGLRRDGHAGTARLRRASAAGLVGPRRTSRPGPCARPHPLPAADPSEGHDHHKAQHPPNYGPYTSGAQTACVGRGDGCRGIISRAAWTSRTLHRLLGVSQRDGCDEGGLWPIDRLDDGILAILQQMRAHRVRGFSMLMISGNSPRSTERHEQHQPYSPGNICVR